MVERNHRVALGGKVRVQRIVHDCILATAWREDDGRLLQCTFCPFIERWGLVHVPCLKCLERITWKLKDITPECCRCGIKIWRCIVPRDWNSQRGIVDCR